MDFDSQHFAKYRLRPGDILVSRTKAQRLVGQSAIYREEHRAVSAFKDAAFDSGLFPAAPAPNLLSSVS